MLKQLEALLVPAEIKLAQGQYSQLQRYHEMLLDWNTRMDLTNVPPEEMAIRHYADSLLVLVQGKWFPQGTTLIDVGTGAGLPGLPLAIARPDMRVCLLDASRKRCGFLSAVIEELQLKNLMIMHARAEDAAKGALRESCDLAVARALAPMNVLCELLLPYVRVGGLALCWKGPSVDEEMVSVSTALGILGAKVAERIMLPLEGYAHYVQSIKKLTPTAKQYPRQAGTPARNPL